MHLSTMHSSRYYSSPKPSPHIHTRSTSDDDGTSIWAIIGPALIVIACIVVGTLLYRFIKNRLEARKHRARGQLSHFQSGSLRKSNQNAQKPVPSAFPGVSKNPFIIGEDEVDEFELQKPANVHGRRWARHGDGSFPAPRYGASGQFRHRPSEDGFQTCQTAGSKQFV